MTSKLLTFHTHDRTGGQGEDMLLFHGGMGSWRHWIRNLEPLSEHFVVHALDLPGYGDSDGVPKRIPADDYFDLVHGALIERFPGDSSMRIAAFSFGAVVSSSIVPRLGARVKGLSLIGPSGFGPAKVERKLDTKNYKLAGDDEAAFEAIMRQNLMAVMLAHPETINDEVLAVQKACVQLHKGMNSRDVSVLDVVPDNLAASPCPVQIIFGELDQVVRGELEDRLDRCRAARPDVDIRIISNTGHWAMYEGADGVNEALLDFHCAR